jgi:hypothetical protein
MSSSGMSNNSSTPTHLSTISGASSPPAPIPLPAATADLIEQLPTDQIQSTPAEQDLTDSIFKSPMRTKASASASASSWIQTLGKPFPPRLWQIPILIAILYIVLSLPYVETTIQLWMGSSWILQKSIIALVLALFTGLMIFLATRADTGDESSSSSSSSSS